ncbi:beta/gamma crystallin-related protein [Shimazuella sp. AN120528]|uniref:beta/gamma crystallin-related protein n=1 Tax=Shimazuella soli TaxID=1892854 RepID=UPI001F10A127|nr:beta/gamma crystallin-related protein [Shimazuella soli]MCH5585063.1 beta/gamma crystallin-related protein [Shimazuella soli]
MRKNVLALSILTSVFALVPNFTFAAPKKATTCVILYEKEHYQGKSIKICQNTPDLGKYHFNDKTRSVKVEGNATVTIYDDINYKGASYVIEGKQDDGIDPITSSIRIHNQ